MPTVGCSIIYRNFRVPSFLGSQVFVMYLVHTYRAKGKKKRNRKLSEKKKLDARPAGPLERSHRSQLRRRVEATLCRRHHPRILRRPAPVVVVVVVVMSLILLLAAPSLTLAIPRLKLFRRHPLRMVSPLLSSRERLLQLREEEAI